MMICDADFEELFASRKKGSREPVAGDVPEPFAQIWPDDCDRLRRMQARGDGPPDPVSVGVAFGMMPAAFAFGTAAAMMAAYGRLLRY